MGHYSLIKERWIPVRRKSGRRDWIAPFEIVDSVDTDPVSRIDWGRSDFDAATLEFLIGLIAVALPPSDIGDWVDRYRNPPKAKELADLMLAHDAAFVLDGIVGQPQFLQELGGVNGEAVPVSGLFIEAPGANTEKNNLDIFQKRGKFQALSLPAIAIAIFTLQAYAPSGGAGHRTSIRGGGPLTTLAVPPEDESVWRRVWLNVPERDEPLPADMSRVFPWLGSTRTSEGSTPPISFEDIDDLGAFWGMPRRIQIVFSDVDEPIQCSVTGLPSRRVAKSYLTKPRGMNYEFVPHPLSPSYRQKVDTPWLFLHPQPGGASYRNWLDMAVSADQSRALRKPASCVVTAKNRLQAIRHNGGRLMAAGYDTDNMKARSFWEATYPLFTRADVDPYARKLVEAANDAASAIIRGLMNALEIEDGNASRLTPAREDFFTKTQAGFYSCLQDVSHAPEETDAKVAVQESSTSKFLKKHIRPTALEIFDRNAPLLRPEGREAERIVSARAYLSMFLNGYGKTGAAFFAGLGLPAPEKSKSKAAVERVGA